MSVATQHSPFAVGSKRLYQSEENEDHLQRLDGGAAAHKRYRQRGSPPGRCGSDPAQRRAYAVGHATVAALRALFPEMSDKVISEVLSEYGDNIDAAIKHLTDLRLSTGSTSAAAGAHQAAAAAAAEQQQQPAPQQCVAEAPAGPEPGPQPGPPSKSAAEWVEEVVREMAAAADVADARARAAKVLQAFEQAAVAHAERGGAAPEAQRLRQQLTEAQRENQLLKRAVAIQNGRMQELGGREAEVAQLRQAVEAFQQRVHALEVQNYSLALHLKQAADGKDAVQAGFKNPDIF